MRRSGNGIDYREAAQILLNLTDYAVWRQHFLFDGTDKREQKRIVALRKEINLGSTSSRGLHLCPSVSPERRAHLLPCGICMWMRIY